MTPERKEALIADAARQAEKLMRERLDALGEGSMTVDEIEDLVEEVGRKVDSWLEERLIEEQSPPAVNCAACPRCHQPARYKETREYALPYHARLARGAASLPLLQRLQTGVLSAGRRPRAGRA